MIHRLIDGARTRCGNYESLEEGLVALLATEDPDAVLELADGTVIEYVYAHILLTVVRAAGEHDALLFVVLT